MVKKNNKPVFVIDRLLINKALSLKLSVQSNHNYKIKNLESGTSLTIQITLSFQSFRKTSQILNQVILSAIQKLN
jgi:hypothetical protein